MDIGSLLLLQLDSSVECETYVTAVEGGGTWYRAGEADADPQQTSPVPCQIPSHFTKKDGDDTIYHQWAQALPLPLPPSTPIPKGFSLPSLTGCL